MSELIDVIQQYGITGVLVIIVALTVGIREIYDCYVWITTKVESWRQRKNGIENKEKTIEDRIGELEAQRTEDHQTLECLKSGIVQLSKDLSELTTEFRDDKEERRQTNISNWLEKVRWNIITSANRIANGQSISEEQIRLIFKNYDKYEKTLREEGMTNGECEISMDIIRNYVKQGIIDGTLIDGKE